MQSIKVYQYDNCSTCKKALKFLEARKVSFEPVDIVSSPPSRSEIEKMVTYVGDIKRLFNTSGVMYREMRLSERMPSIDRRKAVDLLAAHGKLIKRPFVWLGDRGLVGFKEDEWKAAFSAKA